jgi:CheY-like chemotaxis protein
LLIIEDDLAFARILLDFARQQGFKGIVAQRGNEGLSLVQQFHPTAIMLDLHLPGIDGWTVLDRLKRDPGTRHIPVHLMSVDTGLERGLRQGAIAFLQKPISNEVLLDSLSMIREFVDRPVKKLLIVEDDEAQCNSLTELIGGSDVEITSVGTGAAALEALQSQHFDCLVVDLKLPDMDGLELLEQLNQSSNLNYLPVIVYTGKQLTPQEEAQLRRISTSLIVKGVRSPERLLMETTLFLHRAQANLPPTTRDLIDQLQQTDLVLTGKKVLVVDDDVRNIFALASLLERYEMEVLYAEDGQTGINMLQTHPSIDVVLMDVMMPEMDGYTTMQRIRQISQFSSLPIIALTAKAMQGDREQCLAAGASDYIPKPVDSDRLLALLRAWLD